MLSTDPKIICTYLFWPIKNSIKKFITAFFQRQRSTLIIIGTEFDNLWWLKVQSGHYDVE